MGLQLKARYTIEAALIMPLVLGLLALALRAAIVCCQEVKDTAEKTAVISEESPVTRMYRVDFVTDLLGDGDED